MHHETSEAPRLRLLEGRSPKLEPSSASLRAWVVLFGALSFCAGHGVFLFVALTRLAKIPSVAELGSRFQLLVLGWFLLAVPLAFLAAGLRRRFQALAPAVAWTWASGALLVSVTAFALYLRAVALA